MSCNHCSTKFNFFYRELGCANCGLSFCSSCLKQKCQIPSKGSGEFHVCRVCHAKLITGSETNESPVSSVPDRFLKRLAQIEANPPADPVSVAQRHPVQVGLSPDRQLEERLKKLKEREELPPSDRELRERLAKLKGESSGGSTSQGKKHVFLPDTRSDQEKVDSLIEQYTSEQNIESAHQSQDDQGPGLATLKGEEDIDSNSDSDSSDYSDLDDTFNKEQRLRTPKQIMSEVFDSKSQRKFPKEFRVKDDDGEDLGRSTTPEFMCEFCNKYPIYICQDCDELLCSSCKTNFHSSWGDTPHKIVLFELPPQ